MKLGMKSRLYNAEVKNRRLALGLTQKRLAALIGYGANSCIVGHVENLLIVDQKSPIIQKLAEFFQTPVDVLCPEWLSIVRNIPKTDERQAEFTKAALERKAHSLMALPMIVDGDQEVDVDRSFMRDAIERSMSRLKPKERIVLEMTMGIPDGPERSLGEVAQAIGLSKQRVSQIKIKALRKLQCSSIGAGLQTFAPL